MQKYRLRFIAPLIVTASLLFGFTLSSGAGTGNSFEPFPLPEFTQQNSDSWLNSEPLRKENLKGRVTLIDFWTFECWNCYRSFPWLHQLEADFANEEFGVIGIHSPEFDHEKDSKRVEEKITEFNLQHPVMMDNDFAYWKSMNNHYWPSFYLVDKRGQVRYRFVGETHSGTSKAKAIEKAVEVLLAED